MGIAIPLILSLPYTVLSVTKDEHLKIKVTTVLGANAPPLTVKLLRAFSSGLKETTIVENKELKYDPQSESYFLDSVPKPVDVGNYIFIFKVVLHDSEQQSVYATGTEAQIPIFVTGLIKIDNAEIAVLDSDHGSVETQKKLHLGGENAVSLSANHLQKLRLSFELTTPYGDAFKPHQVSSLNTSDFLGLVEKFFYLSGRYEIQLTVGDAVMENSLLQDIGYIELDLPEPPEKAPGPPALPVDPYSTYGPKAEITHIFRAPEKRPPQKLSLAFLGLTLLPFIGFLIGLLRLGVNLKNFPASPVPATFAILFQLGIAAVLLLYVLFWLKVVGSIHNIEGTWFLGGLLNVRWSQDPFTPGFSFSQSEICLNKMNKVPFQ
ncbi:hypothetical protein Patl1_01758 [Pistacia atlantica]|uniref:Uncharacterized protein n=1 Tax=Pistacia atlantica TaxID=434234 RepID=A0ACC1C4J3_9ROSI|nr:hypothetical protein Patl1_01758 [Pistacia atlantica]